MQNLLEKVKKISFNANYANFSIFFLFTDIAHGVIYELGTIRIENLDFLRF